MLAVSWRRRRWAGAADRAAARQRQRCVWNSTTQSYFRMDSKMRRHECVCKADSLRGYNVSVKAGQWSPAVSCDAGKVRRRPLRPFWRPLWLRFTYVTSVLVKKY
eukprot:SAG25_NODE_5570_length_643_cov_1.262868_1_plen_105_part_00